MTQNQTLSMVEAKTRRRREIAEKRERLINALDRVCEQAALSMDEDNIQAALSIASHRRSIREARADAQRHGQNNIKVL